MGLDNVNVIKFDICLMNPPYDKNLHLKFLEKAIQTCENVVSVQPAEWCVRPYIKSTWEKAKNKMTDSIGCKTKNVEILKDNPFDAGIDTMLGIFELSDEGSIEYYNELSNYDTKYLSYINRFKIDKVLNDYIVKFDDKMKYFCPLRKDAIFERWWTLQLVNYLDVIVNGKIYSGKYKGLTIQEARKQNPHENPRNIDRDTFGIEFNTLDELLNFRDSLKTEAYLFVVALLKTTRANPFDKLPYLENYNKQWTNEEIFDLFKVNHKYRSEIIELMKPFTIPTKNIDDLLVKTKKIINDLNF